MHGGALAALGLLPVPQLPLPALGSAPPSPPPPLAPAVAGRASTATSTSLLGHAVSRIDELEAENHALRRALVLTASAGAGGEWSAGAELQRPLPPSPPPQLPPSQPSHPQPSHPHASERVGDGAGEEAEEDASRLLSALSALLVRRDGRPSPPPAGHNTPSSTQQPQSRYRQRSRPAAAAQTVPTPLSSSQAAPWTPPARPAFGSRAPTGRSLSSPAGARAVSPSGGRERSVSPSAAGGRNPSGAVLRSPLAGALAAPPSARRHAAAVRVSAGSDAARPTTPRPSLRAPAVSTAAAPGALQALSLRGLLPAAGAAPVSDDAMAILQEAADGTLSLRSPVYAASSLLTQPPPPPQPPPQQQQQQQQRQRPQPWQPPTSTATDDRSALGSASAAPRAETVALATLHRRLHIHGGGHPLPAPPGGAVSFATRVTAAAAVQVVQVPTPPASPPPEAAEPLPQPSPLPAAEAAPLLPPLKAEPAALPCEPRDDDVTRSDADGGVVPSPVEVPASSPVVPARSDVAGGAAVHATVTPVPPVPPVNAPTGAFLAARLPTIRAIIDDAARQVAHTALRSAERQAARAAAGDLLHRRSDSAAAPPPYSAVLAATAAAAEERAAQSPAGTTGRLLRTLRPTAPSPASQSAPAPHAPGPRGGPSPTRPVTAASVAASPLAMSWTAARVAELGKPSPGIGPRLPTSPRAALAIPPPTHQQTEPAPSPAPHTRYALDEAAAVMERLASPSPPPRRAGTHEELALAAPLASPTGGGSDGGDAGGGGSAASATPMLVRALRLHGQPSSTPSGDEARGRAATPSSAATAWAGHESALRASSGAGWGDGGPLSASRAARGGVADVGALMAASVSTASAPSPAALATLRPPLFVPAHLRDPIGMRPAPPHDDSHGADPPSAEAAAAGHGSSSSSSSSSLAARPRTRSLSPLSEAMRRIDEEAAAAAAAQSAAAAAASSLRPRLDSAGPALRLLDFAMPAEALAEAAAAAVAAAAFAASASAAAAHAAAAKRGPSASARVSPEHKARLATVLHELDGELLAGEAGEPSPDELAAVREWEAAQRVQLQTARQRWRAEQRAAEEGSRRPVVVVEAAGSTLGASGGAGAMGGAASAQWGVSI